MINCKYGYYVFRTLSRKPSANPPLVTTLFFLYIMISIFFIPVSSYASGSEVSERFNNSNQSGQGWDKPAGGIPQKGLSLLDILIIKKSAEGGDPESQLIMGHAYFEGVGVLKDHRMAIEMFRKAAEKDHPIAPIAQYTLGAAYHDGIMVPLDFAESLKWTRKSAEAGYGLAQHLLAEMYKFGDGVEQSYTDAFTLYYRAALKGHPDSQYQVGLLHLGGKGCAKNENVALNWLRCAAAQGHQDSKEVLVELQLRSLYPQKRHRQWPLE